MSGIEPFQFTTAPWHNHWVPEADDWTKVLSGPYKFLMPDTPFRYGTENFGLRRPLKTCSAECQPHQAGLVCSPESKLIVADSDDPKFFESRTGAYLLKIGAVPISIRPGTQLKIVDGVGTFMPDNSHRHYGLDARGIPDHLFPRQRTIKGGDIKAAGFVPVPGSMHKSGGLYEQVDDAQLVRLIDHPELLEAIRLDSAEAHDVLRQARKGLLKPPGGFKVSVDGIAQEPVSLSLVGGLVTSGMDKEPAWAEWLTTMGALPLHKKPWTEKDRHVFDRHWKYCTEQQAAEAAETAAFSTLIGPAYKGGKNASTPVVETPVLDGRWTTEDLAERAPVANLAEAMAKVALEVKHKDSRGEWKRFISTWLPSRDWDEAPTAAEDVYVDAVQRWILTGAVTREYVERYLDPTGESLRWLNSWDHPLLAWDPATDCLVPLTHTSYPRSGKSADELLGWRYPRPGTEGRSWTKATHDEVEDRVRRLVRDREAAKKGVSYRDVAVVLNDPAWRAKHGLEGHRIVNKDTAKRILKRLQEKAASGDENGVYVTRQRLTTMRDHRPATIPARLTVGVDEKAQNAQMAQTAERSAPILQAWASVKLAKRFTYADLDDACLRWAIGLATGQHANATAVAVKQGLLSAVPPGL